MSLTPKTQVGYHRSNEGGVGGGYMIHFHSTNSVLIIGFYIRYDLYIPVYIRLLQNSASLWFVCKERQRFISILPMFSPLYKMGNQYSSLAHIFCKKKPECLHQASVKCCGVQFHCKESFLTTSKHGN